MRLSREMEDSASIDVRRLATIHLCHAHAIGRLQLLAEVARLGRDYVPVLRHLGSHSGTIDALEDYVKTQHPDFYDLHSLVSIKLWSILEAFVRDVCCFLIETVPSVRNRDALQKLKAPIIQFLQSSSQEQADFLYETIETSCSASLKPGVGRFEAVLSDLGYGGPVHDRVRAELYHLSRLRNCIVHNDGLVDKKLISACPQWKGTEGTRVGITAKMSQLHLFSVGWYMLEVMRRISNQAGIPPQPWEAEQTKYLDLLLKGGLPGKFPFI